MNLEDAAQIGEALGGIAILLTMCLDLGKYSNGTKAKGEITKNC
ncbi:MAG: hypothetical protein CM15mP9_2990 [Methanobacteriota archaeon]|nr:MAG: hypothetical protein CM15mP9_2990 [Euryarchaeota archaeon]